jgi:hypothetical protein
MTGRLLLERDEQLAALRQAMDAAVAGQGSQLLLGGVAAVASVPHR